MAGVMPELSDRRSGRGWFPFTVGEVELVLAVVGFAVTSLAFVDVPPRLLAVGSGVCLAVTYLAGLLVYERRGLRVFDFIEDGGLRGGGYVPYFRTAEHSLFLTHTDDDAPSEELLGLYRTLLARGVQMRRVTFLRAGAESARWLAEFGEHPNLEQRVVPSERAGLLGSALASAEALHGVASGLPLLPPAEVRGRPAEVAAPGERPRRRRRLLPLRVPRAQREDAQRHRLDLHLDG